MEFVFWREYSSAGGANISLSYSAFWGGSLNLQTCPTFLFLLHWTPMLVSRFGGGWEWGCFIKYPYTRAFLQCYLTLCEHVCKREAWQEGAVHIMCLSPWAPALWSISPSCCGSDIQPAPIYLHKHPDKHVLLTFPHPPFISLQPSFVWHWTAQDSFSATPTNLPTLLYSFPIPLPFLSIIL